MLFLNESTPRPDSATALPGNTIRVVDAWGRERWSRYDAQERLAEVVEPNPNGNGKVSNSGSQPTKYTYDTLGNLTHSEQIETGNTTQHRSFKYDSLGRLTRQKMAEQTATLNDAGQYVGAGQPGADWSEAFLYDERSNITQKTDPRGVRAIFVYGDINTGAEDPLNRLRVKYYDTSGPLAPGTINPSYGIIYDYETAGDQDRIKKAESPGLSKEEYTYLDGRVHNYTQTVSTRESYPITTTYLYDTFNRVKEIRYPAAYGLAGSPRKIVQQSYDVASRLSALTVDGQQQAGDFVFNAAGQTTSINIGAVGANQVNENYTFDPQTGLLTNQKVQQGSQTLLDLSYNYNRNAGSNGNLNGKTGHLSKILDNKNHAKDRSYDYDALGRLTKAQGGVNNTWTQQYTYDRFGNRENVTATGTDAFGSPIPRDGIANLSYDKNTNRITASNANGQFEYDVAGNQTRGLSKDGQTWLKYEYDSANRLSVVKADDGTTYLQAFQYSPSGGRLMNYDYIAKEFILYANIGGTTLSEYREYTQSVPTWTKSYIYLGDTTLSTISNNNGSENIDFSHPDRLGVRTITNQQIPANYEQTTLPFGTALAGESSISTNRERFTSYDRSDRTGLDYAVNRNYDSKQGRFTQIDPLKTGASSLISPQTLNLYAYCGNDPINHTDSNGLFWKTLFKWISKALKWIAIAAMVAAVVLSVAGMVMTPVAFGTFLKTGLGQVLTVIAGLPARIGSVIAGVPKTIAGIFSFVSEQAASAILGQAVLAAAGSVAGAIGNSFADDLESREARRNRINEAAVQNALWRLKKKPDCAKYIQGNNSEDVASALEKISITYGGSGATNPDGTIHRGAVGDTVGLGKGSGATIFLNDLFYDKNGAVGGWTGVSTMNTANARALIVLHELRHAMSGIGHPEYSLPNGKVDTVKTANDPESNENWMKNIARDCFGVTIP